MASPSSANSRSHGQIDGTYERQAFARVHHASATFLPDERDRQDPPGVYGNLCRCPNALVARGWTSSMKRDVRTNAPSDAGWAHAPQARDERTHQRPGRQADERATPRRTGFESAIGETGFSPSRSHGG